MQLKFSSLRGKLMVGCALLVACVLAAPAAMAHDRYQGRGSHDSNLLGALVVGAVIGGVLVSASNHHRDYYGSGYYYPTASYAPGGYYGGYNGGYPAYGYGGSYNSYPAYGYGGGVNVGVVYSNRGGYYGGSRGYYSHGYNGYRGNNGYRGRDGYRGDHRGNSNNGWNRRGNDQRSHGGYYNHRGN